MAEAGSVKNAGAVALRGMNWFQRIVGGDLRGAQRVIINGHFIRATVEWKKTDVRAGANMAIRAGVGEVTDTVVGADAYAVDVEYEIRPVKRHRQVIQLNNWMGMEETWPKMPAWCTFKIQ